MNKNILYHMAWTIKFIEFNGLLLWYFWAKKFLLVKIPEWDGCAQSLKHNINSLLWGLRKSQKV